MFVIVIVRYFPWATQHLFPKCWPSIGESLSLWRPTTIALMTCPTLIPLLVRNYKLQILIVEESPNVFCAFLVWVITLSFCLFSTGQFLIQKVVPQASGESSKVKVKVRVNIHGIFSVSSASLVEVLKSDETEEPMETEPTNDKEGEVLQPNNYLICHHKIHVRVILKWATCTTVRGENMTMKIVLFLFFFLIFFIFLLLVHRTRCKLTRRSRVRKMLRKKQRRSHVRMKRWRYDSKIMLPFLYMK